jgi:hypothetical protein
LVGPTGFLDDFRIYNRVLSANEISQLVGVVTARTLNLGLAGLTATLNWTQTGFSLQENAISATWSDGRAWPTAVSDR